MVRSFPVTGASKATDRPSADWLVDSGRRRRCRVEGMGMFRWKQRISFLCLCHRCSLALSPSVSVCLLLWMRHDASVVCSSFSLRPHSFSWNASSTVMDPLRRECHLGIIVGRVRQFTNKFSGVVQLVADRTFWNQRRLTNGCNL